MTFNDKNINYKHVLEASCNVRDGGFKKPNQHLTNHCESATRAAAQQYT